MTRPIAMLVLVLATLACCAAWSGDALAQTSAATLPDSTLGALKGRRVAVTTTAGLSAKGEFAAFDAKTVTLIKDDSELAVIPRSDIAGIAIDKANPAAAPPPVSAQGAPPSVAPGGPAPVPVPAAGPDAPPGSPAELQLFSPWQPGVRSNNPALPEYEQHLHVTSGARVDHCAKGNDDPMCIGALREGAKRAQSSGSGKMVAGIVVVALGGAALPFGIWQLVAGAETEDARSACEDFAAFDSACDELNPISHYAVGGMLTGFAGLSLIIGGIFAAAGASDKGAASDYLDGKGSPARGDQGRIRLSPIVAPGLAGMVVDASF